MQKKTEPDCQGFWKNFFLFYSKGNEAPLDI